jgi:hypothetical protein
MFLVSVFALRATMLQVAATGEQMHTNYQYMYRTPLIPPKKFLAVISGDYFVVFACLDILNV